MPQTIQFKQQQLSLALKRMVPRIPAIGPSNKKHLVSISERNVVLPTLPVTSVAINSLQVHNISQDQVLVNML